jgi:hypothetical protein
MIENEEEQELILGLHSLDLREQFIISKALCIAVSILSKEKYPPESDMKDMRRLVLKKFPIYAAVEEASSHLEEAHETLAKLEQNDEL